MFDIKGIKFDEYKSFSTDNKINNIKKVNVFIGKNNSGKLDLSKFFGHFFIESHS